MSRTERDSKERENKLVSNSFYEIRIQDLVPTSLTLSQTHTNLSVCLVNLAKMTAHWTVIQARPHDVCKEESCLIKD